MLGDLGLVSECQDIPPNVRKWWCERKHFPCFLSALQQSTLKYLTVNIWLELPFFLKLDGIQATGKLAGISDHRQGHPLVRQHVLCIWPGNQQPFPCRHPAPQSWRDSLIRAHILWEVTLTAMPLLTFPIHLLGMAGRYRETDNTNC